MKLAIIFTAILIFANLAAPAGAFWTALQKRKAIFLPVNLTVLDFFLVLSKVAQVLLAGQ